MRWPRISRKSLQGSDLDVTRTDNNNIHDAAPDDLALKPLHPNVPGLSQMFTDAALYERVLNAGPESLKTGFLFGADDQALPKCIDSFNGLIGRDLDGAERAISGKLATLTVNNWASREDAPSPDTASEEEPVEASSTEDAAVETTSLLPTLSPSQEEIPNEPKLTPEEVVDLLEEEFGALAPPGEEKLLLETDAAFLRDVVILVSGPPTLHFERQLTSYQSGCCSRHYASFHIPRIAFILSARLR